MTSAKDRQARHLPGHGAFARYIRTRRMRHLAVIAILAVLALISGVGYSKMTSHPNQDAAQSRQISALEQKIADLSKPVFPVGSVVVAANNAAFSSLNYSDQFSQTEIASLQDGSKWNGAGVSNLQSLVYNPDPNLVAPVTKDGYSAVPFEAKFLGSNTWTPYWVPVHQTGPTTAVVAGTGQFFNTPPTFVTSGCPSGSNAQTGASNTPYGQAVSALVKGADRYTPVGKSINFNGNGLTGATASSETVCGSGTSPMVIATITFQGPTKGAAFSLNYAFKTTSTSSGVVITDVGFDLDQAQI